MSKKEEKKLYYLEIEWFMKGKMENYSTVYEFDIFPVDPQEYGEEYICWLKSRIDLKTMLVYATNEKNAQKKAKYRLNKYAYMK